jgi:hypothetical protein
LQEHILVSISKNFIHQQNGSFKQTAVADTNKVKVKKKRQGREKEVTVREECEMGRPAGEARKNRGREEKAARVR